MFRWKWSSNLYYSGYYYYCLIKTVDLTPLSSSFIFFFFCFYQRNLIFYQISTKQIKHLWQKRQLIFVYLLHKYYQSHNKKETKPSPAARNQSAYLITLAPISLTARFQIRVTIIIKKAHKHTYTVITHHNFHPPRSMSDDMVCLFIWPCLFKRCVDSCDHDMAVRQNFA